MLSWRSTDISKVEQACDRVAQALLTTTSSSSSSSSSDDDSNDRYPPFTTECCGSFPVRTAIGVVSSSSSSCAPSSQNHILYNADVVFEIPEDLCDKKDVENGLYLEKRDEMMSVAFKRIQNHLVAVGQQQQQQKQLQKSQYQLTPTGASLEYQPGSGNQKRFIRVVFSSSTSGNSGNNNLPFLIVAIYCRPRHAGIVNSAKGIVAQKYNSLASPWYGSLVVEDLAMPRFAKQHADINARSPAFAVASQLLRKWATSCVGLVTPAAGALASPDSSALLSGGLNLFTIVTAPMLLLLNENTITPSTNVESMVRAVWIYWSKFAISSGVNVVAAPTNNSTTTNNSNNNNTNNNNNNNKAGNSIAALPSLCIPSEPYLNIFHRALANFSSGNAMRNSIDSLVALGEAATGALKVGGSIETLLSPIATLGSTIFERFDAVIRTTVQYNGTASSASGSKFVQNDQQQQLLCGQLQEKLKAALLSRASSVVVGFNKLTPPVSSMSSAARGTANDESELLIAIEFTSEPAARSRLFKGPTIDDKKACAEFESLWGSQYISTRQFADGSINRCVVLNHPLGDKIANAKFDFADPCSGLRAVCDAVEILVRRHFEVASAANKNNTSTAASSASDSSSLAALVSIPESSSFQLCFGAEYLSSLFQLDASSSTARDPEPYVASLRADAVEAVREKLNEIAESSLPCKITGVEFVSPSERGTDPFPPLPHISILTSSNIISRTSNDSTKSAPWWCSNAASFSPIHGVIHIEDKKNKIPDNLEAIDQLKSVLLAQLAKGFETSSGFTAHVTRAFADVLHHESGFMFRFAVLFEREILVMQQVGKDAEAVNLSRALIWTQRHAQFMRSGVLVQHASAAGACRLLRKWVCSMCLGDYIPNEVTELVVAYVYLSKPRLLTRAFCSAQTAFIASLRLLASFPFETTPLVFPEVDSDRAYLVWREEVRKQQQQQQQQQNTSAAAASANNSNKVPSVAQRAMFIAAPYTEPDHSPFTEMTPRRGVLQVLQRCASSAVASIVAGTFGNVFTLDANTAFTFSLLTSDSAAEKFSINPSFSVVGAASASHSHSHSHSHNTNSAISSRVIPKIAALPDAEAKKLLLRTVETNAVTSAVKTLRRQFRDRCMIFYDEYSPASINGIEFGNFSAFNKKNKSSSLPLEMFAAASSSGGILVAPPKPAPPPPPPVPAQQLQQQKGNGTKNQNTATNSKQAAQNVKAVAGKKKQNDGNAHQQRQRIVDSAATAASSSTSTSLSTPSLNNKKQVKHVEQLQKGSSTSSEQKKSVVVGTKKVPVASPTQKKKNNTLDESEQQKKKQKMDAVAALSPAPTKTVQQEKKVLQKKKAKTSS